MPPTFTDEGLRLALDLRATPRGARHPAVLAVHRDAVRRRPAGGRRRRHRLPAQGPGGRRQRLRRGARARRHRRYGLGSRSGDAAPRRHPPRRLALGAHAPRARGPRAHGRGPLQRRHRPAPWSSARAPSRSTSPTSSPSSTCRCRRTTTGGCWPSCASSSPDRHVGHAAGRAAPGATPCGPCRGPRQPVRPVSVGRALHRVGRATSRSVAPGEPRGEPGKKSGLHRR